MSKDEIEMATQIDEFSDNFLESSKINRLLYRHFNNLYNNY